MSRGMDLCPWAIAAALVALLLLCGGCQSDDFKPDPNPKENTVAAEQALRTIHGWLEEAKAPGFVMNALVDLHGHLRATRTATDELIRVHNAREKALQDKITDLENTVWERALRTIVSAIAIFGAAGGVWMYLMGGTRFGPATIGASIAAVIVMRFVQATGPMAMIIGYSIAGALAILLGIGVWVRGKAMLDKHRRDTEAIQKKIENDIMAERGAVRPRTMEEILRSIPANDLVKSMTRKARKSLGLPERLPEPETI